MKLISKDLILREITLLDFEAIHMYANDAEVLKYMLWGPNSVSNTRAFIMVSMLQSLQNPREEFTLAIIQKETNTLIGGISLIIKESKGEIGWILNRNFWGKGYAYQATLELLRYSFNVFHLECVEATCDTENRRSFQLMRKLGMVFISTEVGVRPTRDPSQRNRDQYRCEIDKKRYYGSLERGDYARII